MSIPRELQDLIVDIKFYNSTGKNCKICFSTRRKIHSSGMWSGMYRTWYGESQDKLIEETKNLVTCIDKFVKTDEFVDYRYLILSELPDLSRAIGYQKAIYNNNVDTASNLGLYRDSVLSMVSNISEDDNRRILDYKSRSLGHSPSSSPSSNSSSSTSVVYSPPSCNLVNPPNCTCCPPGPPGQSVSHGSQGTPHKVDEGFHTTYHGSLPINIPDLKDKTKRD